MDERNWPEVLSNILTDNWCELKNTLVVKDFVDTLIQQRAVTLDYWMALKARPISESERTEDFLSNVTKFDRDKYNEFLSALERLGRTDLVKALSVTKDNCPQRARRSNQGDGVKPKASKHHGEEPTTSMSSPVTTGSSRSDAKMTTWKYPSTIAYKVRKQALRHCGKHSHSVESPRKSTEESKVEKTAFIKREPNHSDPNIDSKLLTEDLAREQKDRKALAEEQERLSCQKVESEQPIKGKSGEEIKDEFKRTGSVTSMDQSDNGGSPSMTQISSREIIHMLQTVQTDIKHLEGDKEVLQEKMEGLNTRVVTLEDEKTEAERNRLAEVGKLKQDLTNMKESYDQTVKELRKEIVCSETSCQEMKAEIHDVGSLSKGLSGRLQLVEEDKSKTDQKLQEYTKKVQQQESELVNLKRKLEQIETANSTLLKQGDELEIENFSLLEDKEKFDKYRMEREAEVHDLKRELAKLRIDNRILKEEKRQLLRGFVKPVWKNDGRK